MPSYKEICVSLYKRKAGRDFTQSRECDVTISAERFEVAMSWAVKMEEVATSQRAERMKL